MMAPKIPGIYTYTVILRSDSYLDFDHFQSIKVTIDSLFINKSNNLMF